MKKEKRVILHADINHCYAQIEEMLNPELRKVPMAVGGNEASRHGIILAKNLRAKPFQVQTGEPLRNAFKKCPNLLIIPPRMELYRYYTTKVKDIYREYTDKVEDFGLDEAWLDVTASQNLFGDGETIAATIQNRVLEELGLTISIGVSFNKIFAKLGSDMKKPAGLTLISEENYKNVVWPLPVEDLLMVGRATKTKLNNVDIHTIGDLANCSLPKIKKYLGKHGVMIYSFANGADDSNVDLNSFKRAPKSIGNSWTTPKDVEDIYQAEIVLKVIAESVASRLRDEKLKGEVITLSIRNTQLHTITRQRKIATHTDISTEILKHVMELLKSNYSFSIPIRSIGITLSSLMVAENHLQLNLFEDVIEKDNDRTIDIVVDNIRSKFGFNKIKKGTMLVDTELSGFNPKGDHRVFPVGFLKGSM